MLMASLLPLHQKYGAITKIYFGKVPYCKPKIPHTYDDCHQYSVELMMS